MLNVKRILAIVLAALMAISCFAACADENEESSKDISESSDGGDVSSESDGSDVSSETVLESSDAVSDSEEEEESSEAEVSVSKLPDDSAIKADAVDSYFDGSVFIGYSIMMHFGRYIGEWRQEVDPSILGGAIFCAGVSVGFTVDRTQTPDMPETSLPVFKGQAYNFADLPTATGCDTLYIGLSGYSDLKRAPVAEVCVETAYNEAVMGIERIRDKNPDVNIVILSCTYNTEVFEGLTPDRCSNAQVLEYNNLVLDYCTDNGIDFIDVSTALTDENGLLHEDLTNDEEYHLHKNTYFYWLEALRDYAAKKQEGTWENSADMPNLPAF